MDTIFALASGAPPCGVSVVRVSGPRAGTVVEALCGALPQPRQASLQSIRDRNNQLIDHGLVFWFPTPASYTGEDAAEFHIHGSLAVYEKLSDELLGFENVRLAEAGEFTQRAFGNGKIDLTEAEGLADLIHAETEQQRIYALAQADGELSALYARWMDELLHIRAQLEADIDFADEEDVPGSVADALPARIAELRREIARRMESDDASRIVTNGYKVVLAGAPNAGKSSLLNALCREERVIVSPTPGTTRDVVQVRLDLDGHLVLLSDTAGIRETEDAIEAEGARRAVALLEGADLVLHLSETEKWDDLLGSDSRETIRVATKADLRSSEAPDGVNVMAISTKLGTGIDELRERILESMRKRSASGGLLPLRRRHTTLLRQTVADLRTAEGFDLEPEVRAEHLRSAAAALGRITGNHDVEDILGAIFSRFCIGK